MYAVVRLAGKQVIVRPDEDVQVPRLDAEVGSTIRCDDVLLYADGADVRIGHPSLDNVEVIAEILSHSRNRKIIVFKMKRRKRYRRKKGHRQGYTRLRIREISA